MAKIITINGKIAKPAQVIKWLKGVYFLTPDNPKVTDSNTPFRVRVGKADGKEGIFSRIVNHQSSNFDKLYYTVITKINCHHAYEGGKTPLQLEKDIHKLFKEEYKINHRDSWYEFKNLHTFLHIMQRNFHTNEIILENDNEEMGNWSELLNEYKYTQTALSYSMFYDPHRDTYPSTFEWFCTTPVEKEEIRGLVFKDNVVYEEYFPTTDSYKKYQEIVGGYFYCKSTTFAYSVPGEWEDIVIIAKEQDEITQETPFMKLPPSRDYNRPATPPGDTMIVLGDTRNGDEVPLKGNLRDYNYFLDFPCYNFKMNFPGTDKPSVHLHYIPYDEGLTEEGKEYHEMLHKRFKEVLA